LTEFVKYRIPGKSIEVLSGQFLPWNGTDQGFLVADFILERMLLLKPDASKVTSECHILENQPSETTREAFINQAKRIHQEITSGTCEKVVLSRVKSAPYQKQFLAEDFETLCTIYPNAFVYLVSSVHFGTWIGATPEVLVEKSGDAYRTVALAATKKVTDFTEWTSKELFEQGVVNEFIIKRLRDAGCEAVHSNERHEYTAGPLKHLRNEITFTSTQINLKTLIETLHPTPAVSGLPQDKAISLIQRLEDHDRTLYAGVIGVVGEHSSNLFVNLRCAQVFEDAVSLYVGGGHTEASDANAEWEETENKAKTLLNILQNH
jgi:isochorismate synthase